MIGLEKDSAEVSAKIGMLARIIGIEELQDASRYSSNGSRKVADTLSVRDGFEAAVGRSMGNALDFLIYRDHEEILSLEDFRTRGPGFVIEQPHIKNHEHPLPAGNPGVLGQLREFIEPHEGYADVVLFPRTCAWWTAWKRPSRCGRGASFMQLRHRGRHDPGALRRHQDHLENTPKYADILKARAEMRALKAKGTIIEAEMDRQKAALLNAKEAPEPHGTIPRRAWRPAST